MIKKLTLQSSIKKYYLNGLNNSVKWRVKDNSLVVYAGNRGKVCKITLKEFKHEDAEFGIYDVDKLLRLVNITMGDLLVEPIQELGVYNKLKISDSNFELIYALADINSLSKVTYYKDPPEGYEVKMSITSEDSLNLIKGKTALSEEDSFKVSVEDDTCTFLFGDDTNWSNNVTYQVDSEVKEGEKMSLRFDAEIFKEILDTNKDMDKAEIFISTLGVMKLVFSNEHLESEYFVVRLE